MKPSLLIAGVDDRYLDLCQRLFSGAGFSVKRARDVKQCFDQLRRSSADVLLLVPPLSRGDRENLETLRLLTSYSEESHVPVLLVSHRRVAAEPSSNVTQLRRPARVSRLLKAVQTLISEHQDT